ncbi:MAG TPA: BMC domain-containing protein [Desulfosporosinus sp.]|nr:BMC domain-containing protein [Desulfosporosinus sp.]
MKSIKKIDCIGLIEYRSVAKGLAASDLMLKSSNVDLIFSAVLCPGKYVAMIAGDISSVQEAEKLVHSNDGGFLLSSTVITDVDPQVFSALSATSNVGKVDTIGVLETMDAISAVTAADKIVKSAHVDLIEIRLARGMGGKAFVFFNGELANVEEAMRAGINAIAESGALIAWSIIPNASPKILL